MNSAVHVGGGSHAASGTQRWLLPSRGPRWERTRTGAPCFVGGAVPSLVGLRGACLFSRALPSELGSFPQPCASLGPPVPAQKPRASQLAHKILSLAHKLLQLSHPTHSFPILHSKVTKVTRRARRTQFSQGKCLTLRTDLTRLQIQVKNPLKNPRLSFLCRRFPSITKHQPSSPNTPINTYPPF